MRLIVREQAPVRFRNTFVCEIDVDSNDCINFDTLEVPLKSEDVAKLEAVLRAIMVSDYSTAQLREIPNASDFFPGTPYRIDWPYDDECEMHWTYVNSEYFWYDASGVKYHAELVKEPS